MGWERRGGRQYYYRKVRRGGRVTSEYVGRGDIATLTALLDEERRAERQEQREAERRLREEAEHIDRRLAQIGDTLRSLTAAMLEQAGYHRHKGQWRKQRHGRRESTIESCDCRG